MTPPAIQWETTETRRTMHNLLVARSDGTGGYATEADLLGALRSLDANALSRVLGSITDPEHSGVARVIRAMSEWTEDARAGLVKEMVRRWPDQLSAAGQTLGDAIARAVNAEKERDSLRAELAKVKSVVEAMRGRGRQGDPFLEDLEKFGPLYRCIDCGRKSGAARPYGCPGDCEFAAVDALSASEAGERVVTIAATHTASAGTPGVAGPDWKQMADYILEQMVSAKPPVDADRLRTTLREFIATFQACQRAGEEALGDG
jgi:hypothetical protein